MTLFMFSLAGVPPMVGFYAKLAVLQALITTNVTGYLVLAVVAVLLSLIGRLLLPARRQGDVLRRAAGCQCRRPVQGGGVSALLASTVLGGAGLRLLPGGLMAMCRDAILRALAT
jgi:NADH-quinone oxidoreductase subunit N